jgi:hypothetical protein
MNDNERPARRDDHFGNCPECGRKLSVRILDIFPIREREIECTF